MDNPDNLLKFKVANTVIERKYDPSKLSGVTNISDKQDEKKPDEEQIEYICSIGDDSFDLHIAQLVKLGLAEQTVLNEEFMKRLIVLSEMYKSLLLSRVCEINDYKQEDTMDELQLHFASFLTDVSKVVDAIIVELDGDDEPDPAS